MAPRPGGVRRRRADGHAARRLPGGAPARRPGRPRCRHSSTAPMRRRCGRGSGAVPAGGRRPRRRWSTSAGAWARAGSPCTAPTGRAVARYRADGTMPWAPFEQLTVTTADGTRAVDLPAGPGASPAGRRRDARHGHRPGRRDHRSVGPGRRRRRRPAHPGDHHRRLRVRRLSAARWRSRCPPTDRCSPPVWSVSVGWTSPTRLPGPATRPVQPEPARSLRCRSVCKQVGETVGANVDRSRLMRMGAGAIAAIEFDPGEPTAGHERAFAHRHSGGADRGRRDRRARPDRTDSTTTARQSRKAARASPTTPFGGPRDREVVARSTARMSP